MCIKQYNRFRLSYHQRITEMMPEGYAKLIPVPPQPNYKYASEEAGKYMKRIFTFFVFDEIW